MMLRCNMAVVVIKKYSNRRLYDTDSSRYITQEELTEKIRSGVDVRVVDAKSGEDLTQAMLTQIILETPAARLLPVPLLVQLVRMQDDALGEFFGQYVSAALELYLSAKRGAQAVAPYFPFATMPFSAGDALARMVSNRLWGAPPPPVPSSAPGAGHEPVTRAQEAEDIAELKRELADLKREIKRRKRR
jgi:polyhydroxyalkanoate synthesis repressor PhaR